MFVSTAGSCVGAPSAVSSMAAQLAPAHRPSDTLAAALWGFSLPVSRVYFCSQLLRDEQLPTWCLFINCPWLLTGRTSQVGMVRRVVLRPARSDDAGGQQ